MADLDRVLSHCIQIPKAEVQIKTKNAEIRIGIAIDLKRNLETVAPLAECLKDCTTHLLSAYVSSLELI